MDWDPVREKILDLLESRAEQQGCWKLMNKRMNICLIKQLVES